MKLSMKILVEGVTAPLIAIPGKGEGRIPERGGLMMGKRGMGF